MKALKLTNGVYVRGKCMGLKVITDAKDSNLKNYYGRGADVMSRSYFVKSSGL